MPNPQTKSLKEPTKTVKKQLDKLQTPTKRLEEQATKLMKQTPGIEKTTKGSVPSTQGLKKPTKQLEKQSKSLKTAPKAVTLEQKAHLKQSPAKPQPLKVPPLGIKLEKKTFTWKTPSEEPVAKQTPKQKAKVPAEQAHTLKAPVKQTPVEPIPLKIPPTAIRLETKASAVKTPFEDAVAKLTPEQKAKVPSKKAPAEPMHAKKTPTATTSAEQTHAEQAHAEQAHAEQVQREKWPVEMAYLFSGPINRTANLPNKKKPDGLEARPNYPYTIQLGSFRTLVQAKNAITLYKEKGLSPFWSEVNLRENEKWYRVYTGLFETREQAKKYKEEQNLLKSIIKRTPKRRFVDTVSNKEVVPEANAGPKVLSPLKPNGDNTDTKSSVPKSPKSTTINLEKEVTQKKNGSSQTNPKISGSKASGDPKPAAENSNKKSTTPKFFALQQKKPVKQIPAKPVPQKTPSPAMKPDKKAPAEYTTVKKAKGLGKQASEKQKLPESARRLKETDEMASWFSGLFSGMASMPDLKKFETQKIFSEYPYSIQLSSFRTLERAMTAVDAYRNKGVLAYWSEVGVEGNKRFRVYTGFFETREQANKFRRERNLLKSLVKKTPKNVFFEAPTNQQVVENKILSKVLTPQNSKNSTKDNKTSQLDSPKPVLISLIDDVEKEKIRFDRIKKSANGSKSVEIHTPDVKPSMHKSMGKVRMKMPPRPGRPKKNATTMKSITEKKSVEKQKDEMAYWFAGIFSDMTVGLSNGNSDHKTSESLEGYPKYPYSIQLGSFRTRSQAKKAVASYRKKGLSAYWSETDREGKDRIFRVYTGSFKSRDEARKYRKGQNLDRSLVKKTPYSTFVGTYTDKNVLEDQTLLLKSLDCIPYAIEERDGRYRLFVGAFLTKEVAEEKRLALESKGIQSQVITR